ncbi:MAG TPA: hypothetical protein VMT68_10565, partial [Caulobacteraceae bacterium]|nr:hypothetical protein [Caulobacteraceae bacterium]
MAAVSPALLALAKRIVRGAAEFGLDEAGARICGGAWPLVKKMMAPVVSELDRRFPALMLADKGAAAAAADKAADALDEDPSLQRTLADGLASLREGQAEILALLARNDVQLSTIGAAVDRTEGKTDEVLKALHGLVLQVEAMRAPAAATAPVLDPAEVFRALYEANLTAMNQL